VEQLLRVLGCPRLLGHRQLAALTAVGLTLGLAALTAVPALTATWRRLVLEPLALLHLSLKVRPGRALSQELLVAITAALAAARLALGVLWWDPMGSDCGVPWGVSVGSRGV